MDLDKVQEDNDEIAEKYRILAENTVECIWIYDFTNMRFKYISPSVFQLRGVTVEEAMAERLEDSLTPESHEIVQQKGLSRISRFLNGDLREEVLQSVDEFQQYCKDGTVKDIEISTELIKNKKNGAIEFIGVSRDISKTKALENDLRQETQLKNDLIRRLSESEAELLRLTEELKIKNEILSNAAAYDKLTGISNRYYFDQKLLEEVQRSERYDLSTSLIMFDLDHFKNVNDSWGHDVGDYVLMKISEKISQIVRTPDVFARWGGEEFVVLMPQTKLECGNSTIDLQHRQLFELSNDIFAFSQSQNNRSNIISKLENVLEHIAKHFETEEHIIKESGFTEWDKHAELHDVLKRKTIELKNDFQKEKINTSALMAFLLDEVVIGHLIEEDTKFFHTYMIR